MATSIAVSTRSMIDVTGTVLKIRRISPINSLQWHIVVQNQNGVVTRITMGESSSDITGTGINQGIVFTAASSIPSSISFRALPSGTFYFINIREISPTVDFVAVTMEEYSEISPIVLRLPLVTAHKRPIFIKLGRNTTASNDGVYIITRGDSFIDSASRDTELIGSTTFNHSSSVFIGGQSANGTAVNYPCITLFSDGSNWYVANYYPMNTSASFNQYLLAGLSDANPAAAKLATAKVSSVNVFKNDVAARQSGNNMVLLPTPTSPSICMIVYGGDQGTRATGNALIIKDTRGGSWIDGFLSNNPCILTNGDDTGGNAKSSGIVLFYDTTGSGKWYVIGWYYPYQWTWGNSSTAGTYGDIQGYHAMRNLATPAGEERKICVLQDIVGARFFTLPTSTAANPQVIIFKAKNITIVPGASDHTGDTRGLRYSTQYSSTPNSNRINTNTISIKYGSSDSNHATSKYSCVWFISEQVTGQSFLRYYPVIAYVPNP